jgi:hypothetical protein
LAIATGSTSHSRLGKGCGWNPCFSHSFHFLVGECGCDRSGIRSGYMTRTAGWEELCCCEGGWTPSSDSISTLPPAPLSIPSSPPIVAAVAAVGVVALAAMPHTRTEESSALQLPPLADVSLIHAMSAAVGGSKRAQPVGNGSAAMKGGASGSRNESAASSVAAASAEAASSASDMCARLAKWSGVPRCFKGISIALLKNLGNEKIAQEKMTRRCLGDCLSLSDTHSATACERRREDIDLKNEIGCS